MIVLLTICLTALAASITMSMVTRRRRQREDVRRHEADKARVRRYRYSKMIQFVGADLDEYVARIPPAQLDAHLELCSRCTAIEICDDCLRDRRPVVDMHFCPNYGGLVEESAAFDDATRSLTPGTSAW